MFRQSARRGLTRRHVMQGAAGIAITAGLPRDAIAAEEVGPVMAQLSAYMAEASQRALPERAARDTKHHILDTLAAMVSGSELPPGQAALRFARAYGGSRTATVVASDMLLGPIEAAIVNGEIGRAHV